MQHIHYAPSSVPLAASVLGFGVVLRVVKLPLALSFGTSKLWKKFCSTSCRTCSVPGLGEELRVGDPRPARAVVPSGGTANPDVDDLGAGRPDSFRPGSAAAPVPRGVIPPSISVRARSTFGKLKLLLPIGPTTPAAGLSVGFRKAPRGSRSGFLEFSS